MTSMSANRAGVRTNHMQEANKEHSVKQLFQAMH